MGNIYDSTIKNGVNQKNKYVLTGKRRDGRNDILHNVMIYGVILERINKKLLQNKIM